ncbi:MAG TPA: hypothetical protein PKE57_02495, partial [Cellvibrionaceae bacterium]|nr:hypothetical protein [Cellvibrionaceae bacterium]
ALVPILALSAIFLALALPSNFTDLQDGYWLYVLPGELLLIMLALSLPRSYRAIYYLIAMLLCASLFLKIADLGMWRVYARPFNVLLDGPLLLKGVDLLTGVLGKAWASIIILLASLALIGLLFLLGLGLLAVQRRLQQQAIIWLRLTGAGIIFWLVCAVLGWPGARWPTANFIWLRAQELYASWQDLTLFSAQLTQAPLPVSSSTALLEKLKGHDVLVVFVESYGRTLLSHPTSAEHFGTFLDNQYAQLQQQGYSARSHLLTSSTIGGISWLAHATTLSGLWINNQARYDLLLKSQYPSLNQLFRQAGWRSVGIMPAITRDWPEGTYYGYDQFYGAQDLLYKGVAFNWITMPDQYTLYAFEQIERNKKNRANIFAEIVLVSSHAPWTPTPTVLPWSMLNEPHAFDKMVQEGASPEWVWQDTQRIRQFYERSIEYVLGALSAYIQAFGDDHLVVVILGDHQPAPLITEHDGNKDVPIHIISKDQQVMEALDQWHWREGLRPALNAAWPMDSLRNRWLEAFSTQH